MVGTRSGQVDAPIWPTKANGTIWEIPDPEKWTPAGAYDRVNLTIEEPDGPGPLADDSVH